MSDPTDLPENPKSDNSPPSGNGPTGGSSLNQDQMWAMLAYASMFIGIPIFIVPLAMRESELAVFHGRQAAAIFIAIMVAVPVWILVSLFTCGLGYILAPLFFLFWVPTIHGLILASKNEIVEPIGVFGLGNMLFGSINVKEYTSTGMWMCHSSDGKPRSMYVKIAHGST